MPKGVKKGLKQAAKKVANRAKKPGNFKDVGRVKKSKARKPNPSRNTIMPVTPRIGLPNPNSIPIAQRSMPKVIGSGQRYVRPIFT